MSKRECLECGLPIFGRSDKKFCADICRNAYNNKHLAPTNNYIRNVNNSLRRNWRILSELQEKGINRITKRSLFDLGFDFNYQTNSNTSKSGVLYRFCYDRGYVELPEDRVLLVQQERLD